jgi:hypothetical protein
MVQLVTIRMEEEEEEEEEKRRRRNILTDIENIVFRAK